MGAPYRTGLHADYSIAGAAESVNNVPGVDAAEAPTTRRRRIFVLRRPLLEDLERRQLLAFQHFQERAAAGGDVADVLLDAVLGDRGQRVAAAGDAERRAGGDRARQRLGAVRERVELEHAHRAVPHDGARGLELLGQLGRGLRTDVQ